MTMKKLFITILLSLSSFITSGQFASDTLFINNIEIRVYTYKIESDTTTLAYFDRQALKYTKKGLSNLAEMVYDTTRISIVNHIESLYPNALISSAAFENVELTPFNKEVKPDSKSIISLDCYWIGAINHYSKRIRSDSTDYLNYFDLANAFIDYKHGSSHEYRDRIMDLLNSSIELNREFEKAYLLKSRIHETTGIWKGAMGSDPHVDVVDLQEIEFAVNCLNDLLILKPECKKAEDYRNELINKYGL